MRIRALSVGLAVAAAACGANPGAAPLATTAPPATTTTTLPGASPVVPPDPAFTAFDGARVDGDGRALVVGFIGPRPGTGPCTSSYTGEVSETTDQVSVYVRPTFRGPAGDVDGCTAEGYLRTVRVELREPLAARRVVDGSSASEVGVLRLPMPEPTWLPTGWTEGFEYGRGGSWSVTFGPADRAGALHLTVGPASPSPIPPNSTVTGETTVRGRGARWILPGSVGYDQLVLADDRYAVILAPTGLDRPIVERIAASLRPLPVAEGASAPSLPG